MVFDFKSTPQRMGYFSNCDVNIKQARLRVTQIYLYLIEMKKS